jgi:hypothetical protein
MQIKLGIVMLVRNIGKYCSLMIFQGIITYKNRFLNIKLEIHKISERNLLENVKKINEKLVISKLKFLKIFNFFLEILINLGCEK